MPIALSSYEFCSGRHNPDLVLLDIRINGKKDGIELAEHIKENSSAAVVFLTANSDKATLDRAKKAEPLAFIVKPFSKEDLHTAIEVAMINYQRQQKSAVSGIVFKSGRQTIKLDEQDICYAQSYDNYVLLYLQDGQKKIVRSTLRELKDRLPKPKFMQINRSTIVNIQLITQINTENIVIDSTEIIIASKQRRELISVWNDLHGK